MFHSNYLAPDTQEEFLSLLHQLGGEAKVIAGGTDLVPQMRLGKVSPQVLLDPRRLGFCEINSLQGSVQLGACVTHTQVLDSPVIRKEFPALVEACRQVGGPPVRNRGTIAGNLANASPAADSALPLLVYGATLVISNSMGKRTLPLDGFFTAPGQTKLAKDELIRQVHIPLPPLRTAAVFLKQGNRQAMAIAVASVAVRLSFSISGDIEEACIALGSVAPTPLRAYAAEAALLSSPISDDTIQRAAELARTAASPISDLRASAVYRSQMVEVLTRRALHMAWNDARQERNGG